MGGSPEVSKLLDKVRAPKATVATAAESYNSHCLTVVYNNTFENSEKWLIRIIAETAITIIGKCNTFRFNCLI